MNNIWVDEIAELLNRYINNSIGPVKWLPIVVLVWSVIEWSSLTLPWTDTEARRMRILYRQQSGQPLLDEYRRRLISGFLLSLLSGAFIASLLFRYVEP